MSEPFRSSVYTDRPVYADLDAPQKFLTLTGIIATRLRQHPKAICSYSGGSDSDILLDLIERTRQMIPGLPEVKYVFFNTGLEMNATKRHVKEVAEKYGVEIETVKPKIGIVEAVRKNGIPFMSKIFSQRLGDWQKRDIPLSVVSEYEQADDKAAKYAALVKRYPHSKNVLAFICSCNNQGKPCNSQASIKSARYMLEFLQKTPPEFLISAKCCDYCKKQPAKKAQKGYDMIITGERLQEGGERSMTKRVLAADETACFYHYGDQYRFRPLFYVSDADKAWYKAECGLRYSDAYEVYGLTRTGCCGCPINYKAVADLEKIRPFEPNLVKAAWAVFGKSYEYREKYVEYKRKRDDEKRGQISMFEGAEQ